MTDTVTETATETDEERLYILSKAALKVARGRGPRDLSPEAKEFVLTAVQHFSDTLNAAQTGMVLQRIGAPAEVVDQIANVGLSALDLFETAVAQFPERFPEYAERVGDDTTGE